MMHLPEPPTGMDIVLSDPVHGNFTVRQINDMPEPAKDYLITSMIRAGEIKLLREGLARWRIVALAFATFYGILIGWNLGRMW